MINYTIVPISEHHIEGFWHVFDSVARERKYLGFQEGLPLDVTRNMVLDGLKDNRPCFVALCDDIVVGWCDLIKSNRSVYNHMGALWMGVVAHFRGHGIGEALMREMILKASDVGISRIELKVRDDNKPAISLYEKFGFIREGLHPRSMRVDGEYVSLISMALLIN